MTSVMKMVIALTSLCPRTVKRNYAIFRLLLFKHMKVSSTCSVTAKCELPVKTCRLRDACAKCNWYDWWYLQTVMLRRAIMNGRHSRYEKASASPHNNKHTCVSSLLNVFVSCVLLETKISMFCTFSDVQCVAMLYRMPILLLISWQSQHQLQIHQSQYKTICMVTPMLGAFTWVVLSRSWDHQSQLKEQFQSLIYRRLV